MHSGQWVGEALKRRDLRRNRRRHSTNWLVCCSVEPFAECSMLLFFYNIKIKKTKTKHNIKQWFCIRVRITISQSTLSASWVSGTLCLHLHYTILIIYIATVALRESAPAHKMHFKARILSAISFKGTRFSKYKALQTNLLQHCK